MTEFSLLEAGKKSVAVGCAADFWCQARKWSAGKEELQADFESGRKMLADEMLKTDNKTALAENRKEKTGKPADRIMKTEIKTARRN